MHTGAELDIRLQRAAFNRALAAGDLPAIGPILASTAILVAGTDSAALSGRAAQLAAWKREFAAPSRSIYVRTPHTITVSPVKPIAFEQGDWTGTTLGGVHQAGGIYTAKWRKRDAVWRIEAELFLTLS
ncbi:nuclear transport factor 2 family protein [Sphingomonas sp. MG17]|uniref:Nuclear transport factor 2 family protein n=1 Tax=Sphingomonas tagetis TaxID=2949092 RepID=A0A9X2HU61_9SPHN|nr:nuclear transport factor 2 family protein [Sphingomonas tagetis]MCP3732695.1 nuclear transport factor 2 family protein [Sphingomonas tagetis]